MNPASGAAAAARRRIAAQEQAAYLRSLDPAMLRRGHPLSFRHQSVLRLAALHGVDQLPVAELVADYGREGDRRATIHRQLIERLPDPGPPGPTPGLHLTGTPRRHLDRFAALLTPDEPVAFANGYGFARFDPPAGGDELPVLAPQPSSEVSVGALSFYGFSLDAGGYRAFLQDLPISVLAATVVAVAHRPFAGGEDATVAAVRRDARAAAAAGGDDAHPALLRAGVELFGAHERGHRLDPAAAPRTAAFVGRHGATLDALRTTCFPTAHQRAAWSRLAAGASTDPVDVLFLYGDLLANLAAVEAGLSEPAWRLLRCYHWRFLRDDGPAPVPRGNLVLLATVDDIVGHGLAVLGGVLAAPPAAWPRRLREAEREAWLDAYQSLTGE